MTRKSDPQQWRLEHAGDGYYLIDEYGEECGFAGTEYAIAKAALDEIIREDIAARRAEAA